jgi:hypothetical protein
MTLVIVALAVVAAAGAALSTGAREPRLAVLGLLIALLAGVYVADPLPATIPVAARLAGAVLGGYLVWVALRDMAVPAPGPTLALPGAAAVALVAFVAGWLGAIAIGDALRTVSTEGPSIGSAAPGLAAGSDVSRASMAAAFAMVALAGGALILARDVLRLGLGLLLMIGAAERLLAALGGPAVDLEVFAFGLLLAAGGAGVAALVAHALGVQGDLVIRAPSTREVAVRSRGADEAHPVGRRR